MAIGFSVDPRTAVFNFGTLTLALLSSCCRATRTPVSLPKLSNYTEQRRSNICISYLGRPKPDWRALRNRKRRYACSYLAVCTILILAFYKDTSLRKAHLIAAEWRAAWPCKAIAKRCDAELSSSAAVVPRQQVRDFGGELVPFSHVRPRPHSSMYEGRNCLLFAVCCAASGAVAWENCPPVACKIDLASRPEMHAPGCRALQLHTQEWPHPGFCNLRLQQFPPLTSLFPPSSRLLVFSSWHALSLPSVTSAYSLPQIRQIHRPLGREIRANAARRSTRLCYAILRYSN